VSDSLAERPRRRLFDQVSGAPTLVGAGGRFEGRLEVDGPMSLGGTIIGDGQVRGVLSIAEGAHWQGNVQAESAIVSGRVSGDLTVAGRLEIGKSAVIRGAVRADVIAIADGASVDGEITVTGGQPVGRFIERRTGRPTGG
jgi:cytoskeletal protein CcmA (bactofilin family)